MIAEVIQAVCLLRAAGSIMEPAAFFLRALAPTEACLDSLRESPLSTVGSDGPTTQTYALLSETVEQSRRYTEGRRHPCASNQAVVTDISL